MDKKSTKLFIYYCTNFYQQFKFYQLILLKKINYNIFNA